MKKFLGILLLSIIVISSIPATSGSDVSRILGFRTTPQGQMQYSPQLNPIHIVVPYSESTTLNPMTVSIDFRNTTNTPPTEVTIYNASVTNKKNLDGSGLNYKIPWAASNINRVILQDLSTNIVMMPGDVNKKWSIQLLPLNPNDNIDVEVPVELTVRFGIDYDQVSGSQPTLIKPLTEAEAKFYITFVGKYKFGPYSLTGLERNKEVTIAGHRFEVTDAQDGNYINLRVGGEVVQFLSINETHTFQSAEMAVRVKAISIPDDTDTSRDTITLELFGLKPIPGLEHSTDISDGIYSSEIVWQEPRHAKMTGDGALKTIRVESFEPIEIDIPFTFEGSQGRDIFVQWNQNIEEFSEPVLKNTYVDPVDSFFKENHVNVRLDPSEMARGDAPKVDVLEIWDFNEYIPISRVKVELARVLGPIDIIPITKPYVGRELQVSINEGTFPVDASRISRITYRYGTQTPVEVCTSPDTCMNPLVITPTGAGELRVSARVDGNTYNSRPIPITNPPPEYDVRGDLTLTAGETKEYTIFDKNAMEDATPGAIKGITITTEAGDLMATSTSNRISTRFVNPGTYTLRAEFTNVQISPLTKTITVEEKSVAFTPTRVGQNVRVELTEPSEARVTITDDRGESHFTNETVYGERTFTGFPDGVNLTVSVSATGYKTETRTVNIPEIPQASASISFDENANKLVGDFSPTDAATFLYYHPFDEPDRKRLVGSGYSNGVVIVDSPRNGIYELVVKADGYKDRVVTTSVDRPSLIGFLDDIPTWALIIPIIILLGGLGFYLFKSGKLKRPDRGGRDEGYYGDEYVEEPPDYPSDDYIEEMPPERTATYTPPERNETSNVAKIVNQARNKSSMGKRRNY